MFHGWYDLAIEQQQYIDLTSNLAEIGNRSLKNHLSHGMTVMQLFRQEMLIF